MQLHLTDQALMDVMHKTTVAPGVLHLMVDVWTIQTIVLAPQIEVASPEMPVLQALGAIIRMPAIKAEDIVRKWAVVRTQGAAERTPGTQGARGYMVLKAILAPSEVNRGPQGWMSVWYVARMPSLQAHAHEFHLVELARQVLASGSRPRRSVGICPAGNGAVLVRAMWLVLGPFKFFKCIIAMSSSELNK